LEKIHLNTEVESAKQNTDGSWTGKTISKGNKVTQNFDYPIVANGIFCDPFVPE